MANLYYIKSKGSKSSRFYVRQGASSVQAPPEQIHMMVNLSDGDVFETARLLNQNLTFTSAKLHLSSLKLIFPNWALKNFRQNAHKSCA